VQAYRMAKKYVRYMEVSLILIAKFRNVIPQKVRGRAKSVISRVSVQH
jgi:hypothetical protein